MEEYINLKLAKMSVEEYSLKFSKLSRYAPSLVSYSMVEMSHFVMCVADLVREECHTTMIHDDMTLPRLMVYAQSIENSKLRRMARNFKRAVIVIDSKLGLRRGTKVNKNQRVLR